MTIDPALLDILVCPRTHQPLSAAGPDLLDRVNDAVRRGGAVNRGGDPVAKPVTEGLIREDGRVLYPIHDGIPVMLIDESIEVGDM